MDEFEAQLKIVRENAAWSAKLRAHSHPSLAESSIYSKYGFAEWYDAEGVRLMEDDWNALHCFIQYIERFGTEPESDTRLRIAEAQRLEEAEKEAKRAAIKARREARRASGRRGISHGTIDDNTDNSTSSSSSHDSSSQLPLNVSVTETIQPSLISPLTSLSLSSSTSADISGPLLRLLPRVARLGFNKNC